MSSAFFLATRMFESRPLLCCLLCRVYVRKLQCQAPHRAQQSVDDFVANKKLSIILR
jgi:hypothetical protein